MAGLALTGLCAWGADARSASFAEKIILAPQGDKAGAEIARWQARARASEAKAVDFERLGWAYVARARITLDEGFHKLAELTAETLVERFGASDEAALLRGHALHNLHRFAEAEGVARGLVAARGLAWDYALLSDALMEQGKISEAVAACQELANRRPGTEAYSRIAHLRWLKGDLPGAIAAMEEAVKASGGKEAETVAWALVRLSGYRLQAGEARGAVELAEAALRRVAGYPPAELARGRALLAAGKSDEAIGALGAAEKSNPLPEYQWWLADALRLGGREADAAAVEERLNAGGAAADPRTYALYLATRGERPDLACALAAGELEERRDVFTQDAAAWTAASAGKTAEADEAMKAALVEGTRDARLCWHAGELAARAGRASEARAFFAEARAMAWTLTPSERKRLDAASAADAAVAAAGVSLAAGK